MVSDVVAHGVVQEVDEANIIVKSRKSPIVSYEAQLRAIQNESPITFNINAVVRVQRNSFLVKLFINSSAV